MNYAEKLFEKIHKVLGTYKEGREDAIFLLGYNKMRLDLVSVFLEKNEEIIQGNSIGKNRHGIIRDEARAFREFAKKCEELKK